MTASPLNMPRRMWLILATGLACMFQAVPARAAVRTWADLGNDFTSSANWLLFAAPADNTTSDIASFGLINLFNPVLASDRSVNGLQFTTLSIGVVTLSGAGTLTIGSSGINNLATLGTKVINNNLTLAANQSFTNNGSLTLAGNVNNGGNLLTLTGTGSGPAGLLSGDLSGAGGLTKAGTGTWRLSGNNSYSGGTTVSAGVLNLQSDNALGNSSGGTTVASGAALQVQNGITVTGETLTLSGTGISSTGAVRNVAGDNTWTGGVTLNANTTVGSDAGLLTFSGDINNATRTLTVTGAGDTTISGVIGNGSGGLTKSGAGTLTLSGANTYRGATTVSVGVLNIQDNAALGTTTGGTSVASGAALQLQNDITVTGEALNLNGTGIGATGAVRNISGDNTWAGSVTLSGNTTVGSDAGLLTFSGTITNGTRRLTVTGAGDTTISGVIGNGSGGVTKTGAGTLTLSGVNTYTGTTLVSAGVLNLQNDDALGGTGGSTSVTAGATLQLQNNITVTGEALTLNGTGVGASGALRNISGNNTWTGNVTLGSNPGATIQSDAGLLTLSGNFSGNTRTITVDGAGDTTLSGTIGTSSGGITKNGSGTLTLTGTNTFTGATTFNNGIVSVGADRAFGNVPGGATANKLVFDGGTLATTNTFTLSANRGTTLNAGGGTFAVAAGTTLTYNGIIAGAGGLTKSDTGTLVLGGASTYAGPTTLNAGTLQINADNRLGAAPGSPTADQLVFNGGTLATTANLTLDANRSTTVNAGGGTIDIATGTTLTFDASLTGAGSFTQTGGGTFLVNSNNIDLAGEYSLNSGTLALNGFNFNVGTLHITGDSVIDFGSSTASFLTATNLIIDAGVMLTINNWTDLLDYFDVTNNPGGSPGNPPLNQITFTGGPWTNNDTKWLNYDHQITPAPEPAMYGAVLAGLSTLLLAWRRHRAALT